MPVHTSLARCAGVILRKLSTLAQAGSKQMMASRASARVSRGIKMGSQSCRNILQRSCVDKPCRNAPQRSIQRPLPWPSPLAGFAVKSRLYWPRIVSTMRIALAQFNPVVGDIAGNTSAILRLAEAARQGGAAMLLTPELALTGYPPEDLLLRDSFY